MLKKIYKLIKVAIYGKIIFNPPQKKDVVLFDGAGNEILSKLLSKKDYEILFTRKEEINLFIALKTFLVKGFRSSFLNYVETYIKYVRPKIVITFNDNYLIFYEIKKYFDCHFIAVQRGYRTYHNDILDIFKKNNSKYFIDKYFVFNNSVVNHLKRYVSSNYTLLGSPENNFFSKNNGKMKKKEIVYISSYAPSAFKGSNEDEKFISNYYMSEIKVLNNLINFCERKNYKFLLLSKHSNKLNKESEKKFYYGNLKGKFVYIENHKSRNSYEIMNNASLCVGTNSTLVYENLSRENKTFIFNFRNDKHPYDTKRFGYFSDLPSSGEFWYQGKDHDLFLNKMEMLLNLDDNEWKKILKKYENETCYYNYENTILKNYLKKYLSNNKTSFYAP